MLCEWAALNPNVAVIRDSMVQAIVLQLQVTPFVYGTTRRQRVLAFDLETTGVSTSRDRIVQLALIGSNSDGTEISYDSGQPETVIPYESQRIHGISDADVRGQPDFAEIADRVSELIDGCVLIGHNVRQSTFQCYETSVFESVRYLQNPKPFSMLEMVRR